jgi:hypothetical protein
MSPLPCIIRLNLSCRTHGAAAHQAAKLFVFLRHHWHELYGGAFRPELATMCHRGGRRSAVCQWLTVGSSWSALMESVDE